MTSLLYSLFVVLTLIDLSNQKSDRSSSSSSTFLFVNDDTSYSNDGKEESLVMNEDDNDEYLKYIDENRQHKASYKHEQALLADIYSPNRTYISVYDDRIHAFNFSYFTFNAYGTYRFILISIRGDADIYISTHEKYVSYNNYEFSSCTCGIDELVIDSTLKRPIYIGIYGYSQYRTSIYRLLIEMVEPATTYDELGIEQTYSNDDKTSNQQSQRVNTDTHDKRKEDDDDSDDRQHILWNVLLWLLNFLVEILT